MSGINKYEYLRNDAERSEWNRWYVGEWFSRLKGPCYGVLHSYHAGSVNGAVKSVSVTEKAALRDLERRRSWAIVDLRLASLMTEDELTEIIRKEINQAISFKRMIPNPDRSYGKPDKIQSEYTIVQE